MESDSPFLPVPNRVRYEKSWWIVSEFLRRHPDYCVRESHANGIHDLLVLTSSEVTATSGTEVGPPRIMVNREGSIQVHGVGASAPTVVVSTWLGVVQAEDPHEVVKLIERAAGLPSPNRASPTTAKALVYRALSAALTRKLNDRHLWDVRVVDESGGWVWTVGTVSPNLDDLLGARADEDFLRQWSEGHAWFLLRGDEVLAVLSESGTCFFTNDAPLILMNVYSQRRRLDDVVDELLVRAEGFGSPE